MSQSERVKDITYHNNTGDALQVGVVFGDNGGELYINGAGILRTAPGLMLEIVPNGGSYRATGDVKSISVELPRWVQERLLRKQRDELLDVLKALLPMLDEWHTEFPDFVGDKEAPAIKAARAAIAKVEAAK